MRLMIQYETTGCCRVIDMESMTASEFLSHDDLDAPLTDYELDCELDERDLDPNTNAAFRVVRREA